MPRRLLQGRGIAGCLDIIIRSGLVITGDPGIGRHGLIRALIGRVLATTGTGIIQAIGADNESSNPVFHTTILARIVTLD